MMLIVHLRFDPFSFPICHISFHVEAVRAEFSGDLYIELICTLNLTPRSRYLLL